MFFMKLDFLTHFFTILLCTNSLTLQVRSFNSPLFQFLTLYLMPLLPFDTGMHALEVVSAFFHHRFAQRSGRYKTWLHCERWNCRHQRENQEMSCLRHTESASSADLRVRAMVVTIYHGDDVMRT